MSAAVVVVSLLLGWSVRRARQTVRRTSVGPAGWAPRRGTELAVLALSPWIGPVVRWVRRAITPARVTDPAPLLRFRAAIERGASVVQAFESVAAGSDRWAIGARRLVRRVHAGSGVQEAADVWVSEDRDPALRLLADALAISSSTGGSHLRAVDAVIDAVRERAALQREVRALASQAQMSAVVLVLLPMAFAAAIGAFDPRVRAFYVGSALGVVCIVGGCILDVLGALVMHRLVRGVA